VKAGEALHRAQWPPELFQLGNEGSAGLKAIGVELYNRKITFGEANRQIEQLGNSIKARMIPIIKQYQAELAAQKAEVERKREAQAQLASQQQTQYEVQIRTDAAQEQAARLQRAQLFMNYIQAQQQQLRNQVAPRPTYNTNCTTAGSSTNCTTH
jgi:CO dehydrogenase/acetyl-CoA synthase beta subunit